jgi:hypothetical protein
MVTCSTSYSGEPPVSTGQLGFDGNAWRRNGGLSWASQ